MSSVKRLSSEQYKKQLLNVGGMGSSSLAYKAFYKSMPSLMSFVFTFLPDDNELSTGIGNSYEIVDPAHVEAHLIIAKHFGASLANIGDRWTRVYPKCMKPDEAPTLECARTFVSSWGMAMFRRPLTDAEIERYAGLMVTKSTSRKAAEVVWTTWALSPKFLYLLYDQGEIDADNPKLVKLSPHERAAQLAFFLTGTGPDENLIKAANDGSLEREDVYRAEFERLLMVDASHWDQFTKQWLSLEAEPPMDEVSNAYRSGTGKRYFESHGKNFVNQNIALLTEFSRDFIRKPEYSFRDYFSVPLTLKERNWVDNAWKYLTQVLIGYPNDGNVTDLPERRGFLTHMVLHMLRQNQNFVNPIFKGIWVNETFFCKPPDDFPSEGALPADTAIPERDESNKNLTTRELVEASTSPASCQTCHKSWNGFGFALDGYGALGEVRAMERLYKVDGETVSYLNQLPINTTATVPIDGKEVTVNGVHDLQLAIATSKTAQQCFTNKLVFNHGFGREVRASDKCFADELSRVMAKPDGSIKEMMFQALWSDKAKFKRID